MTLDEYLAPFTFDVDMSTKSLTIQVDTEANFGYFRGKSLGDDTWGTMKFNGKCLVDYDETICIPEKVIKALLKKGFTVADNLNPALC